MTVNTYSMKEPKIVECGKEFNGVCIQIFCFSTYQYFIEIFHSIISYQYLVYRR